MTIRHQIEVESISLLVLAAVVGFSFAFYNNYRLHRQNIIPVPVIESLQSPNSTSAEANITNPVIVSQVSPDGKKQLKMIITTNKDSSKTYSLTTTDADGTNQQEIYSVIYMDTADSMSIPFNTWSPDDKYVFITHIGVSGTEAIVFKANGEPITGTEPSINATEIFKTKITNNLYDETTGWASETLLLINTKTPAGGKGTSYWLEVPTKAIIPLSTQF
jgi:hypothetical protein